MTQERVIAQAKTHLQRCLEQRDRPGILTLTMRLVHRHGHPLLEQLLSQPEWSSHRLWWGEQIGHLNSDLRSQSGLQIEQFKTSLESKAHPEEKIPIGISSTLVGPNPSLQKDPKPQEEIHLAKDLANQSESLNQISDGIKITPAQVTKQRLKMVQRAAQREDAGETTMTQTTSKEQIKKGPLERRPRHSLRLRGWLPSSNLPHQLPKQDAA